MLVYEYPLICFKCDEELIFVGSIDYAYQAVGTDMKKIKNMLSARLMKNENLKKPITDFRLKIHEVEIHPDYIFENKTFPVPRPITLPVAAAYGKNESGNYTCVLPLLETYFDFYSIDQLDSLIQHFSMDALKSIAPEDIHRLLFASEPWLDRIRIKIKPGPEKKQIKHIVRFPEPVKILPRIAEKFPQNNEQRSEHFKIFPSLVWERSSIIKEITKEIIKQRGNLLIIGNHGIGKTSIFLKAIQAAETQLKNMKEPPVTFWKTSSQRMISDAKYFGEWQVACDRIISDLQKVNGMLWIIDLINLLSLGGRGPEDSVAAYLLPFIREKKLRIISEVSPAEYEALYRLMPEFAAFFHAFFIEELGREKSIRIFQYFGDYSRQNLKISFDAGSLETAYSLLDRFIKYESFPGKAVRFLEKCLNHAFLKNRSNISQVDIMNTFAETTGLPEILLRDDIELDKKNLEEYFRSRIIGQEDAIEKVCSVIKVFKTGLNDPYRPVATMLFAGPTGVGKTATANALAGYFFGLGQKKNPLVMLDMSEFQYPDQIDRLTGSGGKDPGKLIQSVRENPFTVLLLDEIEKAHPAIFDALLTVLDQGHLVDSYGRAADFRNSIIIMTTNLGAKSGSSMGFKASEEINYIRSIRSFFSPEFYNRIDYVVTFLPLDKSAVRKIAYKELREVEKRDGLTRRNIHLEFTDAVVEFISSEGFDSSYGARPLQRAIENKIVSKIGRFMLKEKHIKNCTLKLDYYPERGVFIDLFP